MLVYGDGVTEENTPAKLARVRGHLAAAASGKGIVRHALLVAALIEAGELAQGICDAEFAAGGERDGRHPAGDGALALTTAIARVVVRSWNSGFDEPPARSGAEDVLATLAGMPLPAKIIVRQPEGFAHYAVYPEAYAAAATDAFPAAGEVRVIGIRSIGTTLAATVAAALDAPVPLTVRPVGHPFRREVAWDEGLAAEFGRPGTEPVAVVDEGPGLSGSSIAAVVRRLEDSGVEPDRIHLLPSHAGLPGPQADEAARAVWADRPRHVRTFDDVVLDARRPAHRLDSWIADLVGPPLVSLQDLSGGTWRSHRFPSESDWPPVHAWQERRKFLCTTASGEWLLRFAGLGRIGLDRNERARALSEAGFTPHVAGWRHGFSVERWHGEAAILAPRDVDETFLDRLGAYLGWRARAFPAEPGQGASPERLFAMAVHNTGEGLGTDAAGRLSSLAPAFERASRHASPVRTDGRLQAWEWLRLDGRSLKTDALDHHTGHDLVGCQDIAWDVAGAAFEFELAPSQLERLMARVERESGQPVAVELVQELSPAYLAFQLGYWTEARQGCGREEDARLAATTARYAGGLARALDLRDGRYGPGHVTNT